MKIVLGSIVLLTLCCAAAYGDQLRLRDGKVISGYYVGGNQKELWFQSNGVGADVYPTFFVESLQFGAANGGLPLGYVRPSPQTYAAQPAGAKARFLSWARLKLSKLYLASILFSSATLA